MEAFAKALSLAASLRRTVRGICEIANARHGNLPLRRGDSFFACAKRGHSMTEETPRESWLCDLADPFFRHWKKAVLLFVLIAVGGATITFSLPKQYHSEGKLFIRLGRENATLDSTATLGQPAMVAVPQSRENEINSVVEILQSRALIERVVDALGPATVLGRRHTGREQAELREDAVIRVAKSLTVAAPKKSSVIEIGYRGASPELCQAVVGKLIDVFLEEHGRINRAHGSREFFAEQTSRLREQLSRREAELRDMKSATGLASPAAQRQQMVARMGRLQDELLETEAARSVAEAKVASLQQTLAGLPETEVSQETSGMGNEGTDRMREQFYALQVREKESQSRYTDDHPKLRQIRDQIAEARALLADEEKTRRHVTREPNKLRRQAEAALLAEKPQLASLRARSDRLQTQLAAVRGELTKLNGDEMRLASMQRDVDLLEVEYRKYSTNLEQARIDRQLENERMSNVSVVQPASHEPRPVRPRVALNLLLGLCMAGLGALALPLALDQFERLQRTINRVKEGLDLPTLATIPRLHGRETVEDDVVAARHVVLPR
ncbi:MAG: hypothetical protein ABFC96_17600 [Thermoguttaceae bacterium]